MSSEIFKPLLVTRQDILKQAVAKARTLIGIDDETGGIILRMPRASLGAKQKAALYLVGQYFAKQMGKASSADLTLKELSLISEVDSNTLSGRLSELIDIGWVRRVNKARFEINDLLLNDLLDEISTSTRKPETAEQTSLPIERNTSATSNASTSC